MPRREALPARSRQQHQLPGWLPLGVITSYSIHYTKLYELIDERVRDMQSLHADAELQARYRDSRFHALVAPRARPGSVVDDALAKLGRERRVALRTSHFMAAVIAVTQHHARAVGSGDPVQSPFVHGHGELQQVPALGREVVV